MAFSEAGVDRRSNGGGDVRGRPSADSLPDGLEGVLDGDALNESARYVAAEVPGCPDEGGVALADRTVVDSCISPSSAARA